VSPLYTCCGGIWLHAVVSLVVGCRACASSCPVKLPMHRMHCRISRCRIFYNFCQSWQNMGHETANKSWRSTEEIIIAHSVRSSFLFRLLHIFLHILLSLQHLTTLTTLKSGNTGGWACSCNFSEDGMKRRINPKGQLRKLSLLIPCVVIFCFVYSTFFLHILLNLQHLTTLTTLKSGNTDGWACSCNFSEDGISSRPTCLYVLFYLYMYLMYR